MPSVNKTPNIGLNQWVGNEYPKRQDFVDDNVIIDQKIQENTDIITTVSNDLVAHSAEGVHQKVEVTNTDDATSEIDAPLKSSGGLAVAKKSYFGDVAKIKGVWIDTFVLSFLTNVSKTIKITKPGERHYANIRIFYATSYADTRQAFVEGVVLFGGGTSTKYHEKNRLNAADTAIGQLDISVNTDGDVIIAKTSGVGSNGSVLRLLLESSANLTIEEVV